MHDVLTLVFLLVPALILAILFEVVIHELGHLIFGWFSGYRFMFIGIFGLYLEKKDGKYRIRYHRGEPRGQCVMRPRGVLHNTKDRIPNAKGIVAGGIVLESIAGVILIIICCLMVLGFVSFMSNGRMFLFAWCFISAVLCIAAGLVNLISKNPFGDGQTLREIKDPMKAFTYNRIMEIGYQSYMGKSFLEMPEEWFETYGAKECVLTKELELYAYMRRLEKDPHDEGLRESLAVLKQDASKYGIEEDLAKEEIILGLIGHGSITGKIEEGVRSARFALMLALLRGIPVPGFFEKREKRALYPGEWVTARNTFEKIVF